MVRGHRFAQADGALEIEAHPAGFPGRVFGISENDVDGAPSIRGRFHQPAHLPLALHEIGKLKRRHEVRLVAGADTEEATVRRSLVCEQVKRSEGIG